MPPYTEGRKSQRGHGKCTQRDTRYIIYKSWQERERESKFFEWLSATGYSGPLSDDEFVTRGQFWSLQLPGCLAFFSLDPRAKVKFELERSPFLSVSFWLRLTLLSFCDLFASPFFFLFFFSFFQISHPRHQ